MKATIPYIEKKFNEFNRQMFEGKLPPIRIELSRAKSFLGACVYRKRKELSGKEIYYDFRLRISTSLDLTEREIEDTLLHEMIHYYIGVNQWQDSSAHGPLFRKLMQQINQKYGRNLSITHRSTPEQQRQAIDSTPRWHVIAKVRFDDGKCGVKVLPRILPRILQYYRAVCSAHEVQSVDLFMSNNPYFNRFPNSSALKVHFVCEDELNKNLEGAESMEYDGVKLQRNQ